MMTGSLYSGSYPSFILSPFFDFYQGILLNCPWLIAMFDEARECDGMDQAMSQIPYSTRGV
jgi:hypothetical protein